MTGTNRTNEAYGADVLRVVHDQRKAQRQAILHELAMVGLPRSSNTALVRVRRATANRAATTATATAEDYRKAGDRANATIWDARARRLTSAAAMLTTWLDWLERDAAPAHRDAVSEPHSGWGEIANVQAHRRRDDGPYVVITQPRRTPLAPRAPALSGKHVAA
ncbi:hypothetical protein H9L21_01035 [Aeromicrobium senzhongii]|uniref:Uncharacterized protein n=1 Tax=Aeromicrobium senzhongii TaxID=2663859 RepID=A0ABX6ST49_9ACTN|nr:hypothetical protein [Aeromicrobium senzhongii]MTB88442.1 hypothetical protein [Aeromicrobium senzhongii]QNL94593.1 hypothetical protein H9L21_01035 [Aeromicrobium senzhongii]